jgi:hypothetical protein
VSNGRQPATRRSESVRLLHGASLSPLYGAAYG